MGGGKLSDHNDAGPVGGGGSAQRDDGTLFDRLLAQRAPPTGTFLAGRPQVCHVAETGYTPTVLV